MLQDNEKMKVQYLRSFLFDLFETLQVIRAGKGISFDFKFRCYGNKNQNDCLLFEKTKGLLFKQKWCSESNLKQYSLIVSEGSVKFWRKIGDALL